MSWLPSQSVSDLRQDTRRLANSFHSSRLYGFFCDPRFVIQITIHELRVDPIWDPLRANPRFQQMLAKSDAPK
jgi:hypothetical protein